MQEFLKESIELTGEGSKALYGRGVDIFWNKYEFYRNQI